MGLTSQHRPVLLVLAAFSRYQEALSWARLQAEACWGETALVSDPFAFQQTTYYEDEMGPDLVKIFYTFKQLIDPAQLVQLKQLTNGWEEQYADISQLPQRRPLNLDPGYLTEAKLVLASTKDRDHRIYLDRGIFAEITLFYHRGGWRCHPWTYPDYRSSDYHQFFTRCREYLRAQYRK